jgi:CheY-like chemotaxis protein
VLDSPNQSQTFLAERVLVVDGYETDLRALVWLLQDSGYDVTYASSVATARQLSALFDAVVLEIEQQDGSGVELAGAMLASGRARRAAFYTECESAGELREAERVAPVVLKDAGPEELLNVLRSVTLPESHFPAASPQAHAASNLKKFARGSHDE